jgi:hypothetical protein
MPGTQSATGAAPPEDSAQTLSNLLVNCWSDLSSQSGLVRLVRLV